MSRDELSEELREFLLESLENLDQAEQDLVGIEIQGDNREVLAAMFRTLHSVKGGCGFFDLDNLARLAHEGEGLLALLRDRPSVLSDTIVQLLFDLLDGLRSYLGVVEATGSDGEDTTEELCQVLQAVREDLATADSAPKDRDVSSERQLAPNIVVFSSVNRDDEAPRTSGNSSSAPDGVSSRGAAPVHANLLDQAIRVDVSLLDRLVNLVGELVLVRNRAIQIGAQLDDAELTSAVQRLNLITTELQEQVMQTRMQPMDSLFAKLPRLVRDIAKSLGKQVRLNIAGGDTELDRGILEALRDPIVHLLRNSLDHGIETPEQRERLGKNPTGRIDLVARHIGGSVTITMTDDGAGIDPNAIAERAVKLGLVSGDQVATMTVRERLELIFLPGFSTSEQVTTISGRGVGMDVVRTNIEQVSGTIEVNSEYGHSTTTTLRIPLTLAIIPCLMLSVAGEAFALPQHTVVELLRLERESMADELAFVGDVLFLRRNQQLLPIVDLGALLKLGDPIDRRGLDMVTVVVVQVGGHAFGIIVDRVVDTQEIVVKPLDALVNAIGLYAGATILGNGDVAMILDAAGIASHGSLDLDEIDTVEAVESETVATGEELALLVDAGDAGLVAIPVFEVGRIEQLTGTDIEYLGAQRVVQHQERVVALTTVSELEGGGWGLSDDGVFRVLAPSFGGGEFFIAIREIVDLVTIADPTANSTILGGKIVRILSLADLLAGLRDRTHERV